MNLVDSCGWLEYFADGPNAGFYAPALEDPGSLLVPAICLRRSSSGSTINGGKMRPSKPLRPCTRAL
jgi:hypothetical protein